MSSFDLLAAIGDAKDIGITGHIRPDGDCIGSCLGMLGYLRKKVKNAVFTVYLEDIPTIYADYPGADCIISRERLESDEWKNHKHDCFLVLDCNVERTGYAVEFVKRADCIVNIDHHISNAEGSGDVNHVCPEASSCCEVIYELMDPAAVDSDIAMCLYSGIVSDSGVFQYSSTSKRTMEIGGELIATGIDFPTLVRKTFYEKSMVQNRLLGHALLDAKLHLDGKVISSYISKELMDRYEARPKHLDGIASQLRNTRGVECAIFIYDLGDGELKVSLRTDYSVDASVISVRFGGGGHARAAGFNAKETPEGLLQILLPMIEEQLCQ